MLPLSLAVQELQKFGFEFSLINSQIDLLRSQTALIKGGRLKRGENRSRPKHYSKDLQGKDFRLNGFFLNTFIYPFGNQDTEFVKCPQRNKNQDLAKHIRRRNYG